MMGDDNIDDDNIPFKQNSQQWRLQQPNNSAQRPLGMAPIIPQMDPYDPIERPRNYANFKHFRNNRRNNNNNNQNNMRRNFNNTQNNNFNRNNNNRYNNNRNNNNNFSRNDNFLKEQIRNISLNNRNANNNNFTVTSQLSLTSPSAQLAEAQNILARSNITKNDMGTIAGTLMALLRESAPVPHGPKYDMDVQKEIHAIQVRFTYKFLLIIKKKNISFLQKKPLFYKQSKTGCGGEVISSDGVGIDDDVKFTPSATSTSINQRFS